mmetsp:Transcript_93942/g.274994  ORF Transcript_93942/g.274994 Transcript_93942/m.274994 type:complete len:246 (-) Transcript_93942:201-938(-)
MRHLVGGPKENQTIPTRLDVVLYLVAGQGRLKYSQAATILLSPIFVQVDDQSQPPTIGTCQVVNMLNVARCIAWIGCEHRRVRPIHISQLLSHLFTALEALNKCIHGQAEPCTSEVFAIVGEKHHIATARIIHSPVKILGVALNLEEGSCLLRGTADHVESAFASCGLKLLNNIVWQEVIQNAEMLASQRVSQEAEDMWPLPPWQAVVTCHLSCFPESRVDGALYAHRNCRAWKLNERLMFHLIY